MAVSTIKASNAIVDVDVFMFAKGSGPSVTVSGWDGNYSVPTGSYRTVGILPEAYRPRATRFIPAIAGNGANIFAVMRILPDGSVGVMAASAITNQLFLIGGAYNI